MITYTMNDAENFTPAMLGSEIIAGYLGGEYAAGQPWTDANWAACAGKKKVGIWVPQPAASQDQARNTDLFHILDKALHFRWPAGQPVIIDLETSKADSSYVDELASCLLYFDIGLVAYGSLSTIVDAVPAHIWKWSASWPQTGPGTPHLDAGMYATQWTSDALAGVPYDQSVVTQELYDRIAWV